MDYAYDEDNIFAKILRGEIPSDRVAETDHALAFNDIRPQAPIHILVIPRGPYVCHDHFALAASEAEIVDFVRLTGRLCRDKELVEGGYRVLGNAGRNASQEVPHYHLHLLGGGHLGPMLARG